MAEKLSGSPVCATIAVKDLGKARKFYEDLLGYKPMQEMGEGEGGEAVMYMGAQGTGILVYVSEENAGTNKATCASWMVKDLDGVLAELKAGGVEFEDYDQPGLKTKDGVATWEEGGKSMRAAWFRDPDGNILNVAEM